MRRNSISNQLNTYHCSTMILHSNTAIHSYWKRKLSDVWTIGVFHPVCTDRNALESLPFWHFYSVNPIVAESERTKSKHTVTKKACRQCIIVVIGLLESFIHFFIPHIKLMTKLSMPPQHSVYCCSSSTSISINLARQNVCRLVTKGSLTRKVSEPMALDIPKSFYKPFIGVTVLTCNGTSLVV